MNNDYGFIMQISSAGVFKDILSKLLNLNFNSFSYKIFVDQGGMHFD